jgi:hypothetical protein
MASQRAKADGRTRTGDPFITSEVLYQLSYVGARPIVARSWRPTMMWGRCWSDSEIPPDLVRSTLDAIGCSAVVTARSPQPTLGVLCLESVWYPGDLQDQSSVLPLLQTLERRQWIRFVHGPVGTPDQLSGALKLWTQRRYAKFHLCYLAMHGDDQEIYPDADGFGFSLKSLGDLLEKRAKSRLIHLGSCRTLFDDDPQMSRLAAFRKRTQAGAVIGHEEEVDWEESAAFELLLFSTLAWKGPDHPSDAFAYILANYRELAERVGFVARTMHKLWRART